MSLYLLVWLSVSLNLESTKLPVSVTVFHDQIIWSKKTTLNGCVTFWWSLRQKNMEEESYTFYFLVFILAGKFMYSFAMTFLHSYNQFL